MKNYKNIYSKRVAKETKKCFICQKKIMHSEKYFSESSIFIHEKYIKEKTETPYFIICLNCVKTPEKAEEVMIPLLKIMYGYEIKVVRNNLITKKPKEFYY